MAKEIEAKIKVADLGAIRARLLGLGAVDEGERFERNWVLDDARGSLLARGTLLRVRTHGDGDGILTVKSKAKGGAAFKTREEVECAVDSIANLMRQMEMLGFAVDRIYEKRRRTMLWGECEIVLDELPEIGSYVEVEGTPEGIHEVIVALGLNPDDHINDNYLGLWKKYLKSRKEPYRHMIFGDI